MVYQLKQMKKWFTTQPILIRGAVLGTVLVGFIIIVVLGGYIFSWEWVGVVEYRYEVNGELKAFQRSKTLWDWLDLLFIPVVLSLGLYWLNQSARESEQAIAKDKQLQETLEAYFNNMSKLMLEGGLGLFKESISDDKGSDKKEKQVQSMARAMTLSTLRSLNLDGTRKGQVVKFLSESGLIHRDQPSVHLVGADLFKADLRRADLSWADLSETDLRGADLSGAKLNRATLFEADLFMADLVRTNLSNANLNGAKLGKADLHGANLSEAFLHVAKLPGADLSRAFLYEAKLRQANLVEANLNKADLHWADLHWAVLRGADLRGADLSGAKYNIQTIWPDGFDPQKAGAILEE